MTYIHIKVRVTKEQRIALKVKTAKQGITIQDVLIKAVKNYLSPYKLVNPPVENIEI